MLSIPRDQPPLATFLSKFWFSKHLLSNNLHGNSRDEEVGSSDHAFYRIVDISDNGSTLFLGGRNSPQLQMLSRNCKGREAF
jgi:hypothetical protein